MSSVDQLFDRFGDLLRSWIASDGPDSGPVRDATQGNPHVRSADPFLDEAMEELDAYLDDDREAQERIRRERDARARAEEQARSSRARPVDTPQGPPQKLLAAYRVLGLSYGATFAQAKATYKRLLKEHHPDRHGSTPDALRNATETSARINDAFRVVETWHETGTLGDE
ncbi:MAG TPA: J domain-containing protein [bacterium]|nr:J domain-containing protein [bacterium]